jgi:hypothetical protein
MIVVNIGMNYQIQQDHRSKKSLAQVSRAVQFGAITNITDVWQKSTQERDAKDKYSQQYNQEEHQWIQTVQKTLGHDEMLVITRSQTYPPRMYEQAYILSGDDAAHLKNRIALWEVFKAAKGKQANEQAEAMLSSIATFLVYNTMPMEKHTHYLTSARNVVGLSVFTQPNQGDKEC